MKGPESDAVSGSEGNAEQIILEHYRTQAEQHGSSPSSTMVDEVTRQKEVSAITSHIDCFVKTAASPHAVLEIGCGNGYLLVQLHESFGDSVALTGLDYSPEMLELARERNLPNCRLIHGDVRHLSCAADSFDTIISERCLINVLDRNQQIAALMELHRVLRADGHLILVEAFTDGMNNLNKARSQLGLESIDPPHHNVWLDKRLFLDAIQDHFVDVTPEHSADGLASTNFLSSHYFISRVVYPAITQREIMYNTEFVRFFQFLPPMGLYSPIQLFVLRRRS